MGAIAQQKNELFEKMKLAQAGNPAMHSTWAREMEIEMHNGSIPLFTSFDEPERPKNPDRLVGHRLVNTREGCVRAPVFESSHGSRYYISPLTDSRVAISW